MGSPLWAGEPVEIRSSDVALNEGGLLKGTVLNTAAQPVAGVKVNVLHEDKVIATSMSDKNGEFTVKGLRNGAHVVKVGTTQKAVRLWGSHTAPPAAVENVAIVVDEETVRGQIGGLGALGGAGGLGSISGVGLAAGAGVAAIGGAVVYTQQNKADPASP